jgi:hypothetical protein
MNARRQMWQRQEPERDQQQNPDASSRGGKERFFVQHHIFSKSSSIGGRLEFITARLKLPREKDSMP